MKARYYIYILICDNNSYYTGYTTDLSRRYKEHVQGTGKCKFTRSFKPVTMAQSWEICASKAEVMRIERFIKKLSRKEKGDLIRFPKEFAKIYAQIKSVDKSENHSE